MEYVFIVLAVLCGILGIIGSVLPVLPGVPLSYVGYLIAVFSSKEPYSLTEILVLGVITVILSVMDYIVPVWVTKRFGGSKEASWGTVIGLIVGAIWFPPFGLILGAFLGAFVGELIHDSRNSQKALKVALSSFISFLLTTGLKLIFCAILMYYLLKALF
ncbi:MAG: DUF456 domain-containing protein [Bacteroidales bacterium]